MIALLKRKYFKTRLSLAIEGINSVSSEIALIDDLKKSNKGEKLQSAYAKLQSAKEKAAKILESYKEVVDDSTEFKYKPKMKQSLNISRDQMPQISEDNIPEFLLHFNQNCNVYPLKKKLDDLKPTQNEINNQKVLDLISAAIEDDENIERKLVISNDDYIVDGHHNWAGQLEIRPKSYEINVYQIDLPIEKILNLSGKLDFVKKVDVNDKLVKSQLIANWDCKPCEIAQDAFNMDFIELIKFDRRPIGISIDDLQKSINAISNNEDLLYKAAEAVKGKIKVEKQVTRKDGTTFLQHFLVNQDQLEQIQKPNVLPENEHKKLFDTQTIDEVFMKKGDRILANYVGAFTGKSYKIEGIISAIKSDRIVIETDKPYKSTDGIGFPLRKGIRVEIPRVNSKLWSSKNNFQLRMSDALRQQRLDEYNKALADAKIADSINDNPSFVFQTSDPNEKSQVVTQLDAFKVHYPNFDLLSFKSDILNFFDENFKAKYPDCQCTCNLYRMGIGFKLSIDVIDSKGTKLMVAKRDLQKESIYNEYFELNRIVRDGGIAKKFFRTLQKYYRQANVKKIKVSANIDIGGYTWAAMGFSMSIYDVKSLCFLQPFRAKLISDSYEDNTKEYFYGENDSIIVRDKDGNFVKTIVNEKIDSPYEVISKKVATEYLKKQHDLDYSDDESFLTTELAYNTVAEKINPNNDLKIKNLFFSAYEKAIVKPSKTNRFLIVSGALSDLSKREYSCYNPEQCEEFNKFVQDYVNNDNNFEKERLTINFLKTKFPKQVKSCLLGTSWRGEIDMQNKEQVQNFENYIGYEHEK